VLSADLSHKWLRLRKSLLVLAAVLMLHAVLLNGGEALLQPPSTVAARSVATVTTVRAVQTPLAAPLPMHAGPEQQKTTLGQKTHQQPENQNEGPKPLKPAAAALKLAKSKPTATHQQRVRSASAARKSAPPNSTLARSISDQAEKTTVSEPIPAQAPPAFQWKFAWHAEAEAEQSGTATWTWKFEAGRYESRFEAQSSAGLLWRQISQGGWDAFGLAPERFTDERPKSGMRATNFQQAAQTVTFSGPSVTQTLTPGLQDPLSALIQFLAILRAQAQAPNPGETVKVQVVGLRADRADWVFRFIGEESLPLASKTKPLSQRSSSPQEQGRSQDDLTPSGGLTHGDRIGGGTLLAQHWQREPLQGFEGGLELWLDAKREFIPLRLHMQQTAYKQRFAWELIETGVTP
jgi:hypothetical protein